MPSGLTRLNASRLMKIESDSSALKWFNLVSIAGLFLVMPLENEKEEDFCEA